MLATNFGSLKHDGHTSRTSKYQVHFVRYADDFVITGKSKSLLEDEVKPLVKDFLAQRGLTLSEQKTKVTHISQGFDFLGQNIRKYRLGKPNEKLLIKPAAKNVKAIKLKVKTMITKLRTAKQEEVIGVLNPIIQGWANYHHHIVDKETFTKVDHFIWRSLWRWACRRHPNKNLRWVKQRYYLAIENRRNMTFACRPGEKQSC
ncbi:group II intron maturase-specific domain-containing protein [Legionella pneumophila serogroup 1]